MAGWLSRAMVAIGTRLLGFSASFPHHLYTPRTGYIEGTVHYPWINFSYACKVVYIYVRGEMEYTTCAQGTCQW